QGQYEEAEKVMRQALAVNPDYTDVYFSLGTLYADHLKDSNKSVEAFKRYIELGGQSERAQSAIREADLLDKPAR
ncbi:MAG: tetratricopeptide repeat protein, partial [Nitrospiraceae bacterium]